MIKYIFSYNFTNFQAQHQLTPFNIPNLANFDHIHNFNGDHFNENEPSNKNYGNLFKEQSVYPQSIENHANYSLDEKGKSSKEMKENKKIVKKKKEENSQNRHLKTEDDNENHVNYRNFMKQTYVEKIKKLMEKKNDNIQ